MNHPIRLLSSITGALALLSAIAAPFAIAHPDSTIPPDFTPVISSPGAVLYKKEYTNGTPDFVQAANLKEGASIRLLTGPVGDSGAGQGPYGGDNPSFTRQPLTKFWDQLSTQTSDAFCVSNAAFFSTNPDPAPLAFPLKVSGKRLSDGYGSAEFPGQQRMLELWPDHAQITQLTPDGLRNSTAPDILGGLAENALKDPTALIGRTFIGVADTNGDGVNETVLIFTTRTSTQADAAAVLRSFHATAVMMLDGGSSTQLLCRGTEYIHSDRAIPQALAVLARQPSPLSAAVTSQTNYPVLVEGEEAHLELRLRNDGLETWKAGQDRLVNVDNPYGAITELQLQQNVPPGETAVFSWRTDTFNKWGIYTTEWQMKRGDQAFASDPVKISMVVIPKQLEQKRQELQGQVRQWIDQRKQNVEDMILAWIKAQLDKVLTDASHKLCGGVVLPLLSVLVVLFLKRRVRQ